MKKILLGLSVFLMVAFTATAQIQKGSIMLGGKVNFATNNSNSETMNSDFSTLTEGKTNQFTFNPQVGFSLDNNWIVGAIADISTSKITSESFGQVSGTTSVSSSLQKNSYYGGGLFARKYVSFSEHFSAFAEVNIGVGRRKQVLSTENSSGNSSGSNTRTNESTAKYNEFKGSFLSGIAYFPKNWMAIELSTNILNYSHLSQKPDDNASNFGANYDTFNFGLNASTINLGVSFFLNNK